MSKEQQNIAIAEKWFAAFNNHNVEEILALYSATAEHYSPKLKIRQPETGGIVRGHVEMRAWWNDAFERITSLTYKPTRYTANDSHVFMEYTRIADNEPDMYVAEVLEIISGLIVASRVYHG